MREDMYRAKIVLKLYGHVSGDEYVTIKFEKNIKIPFVPTPNMSITHNKDRVFLESVDWNTEDEEFTCESNREYGRYNYNIDIKKQINEYAKSGWKCVSTIRR